MIGIQIKDMEISKSAFGCSTTSCEEYFGLIEEHNMIGTGFWFFSGYFEGSPDFCMEIEGTKIIEVIAIIAAKKIKHLLMDNCGMTPSAHWWFILRIEVSPTHIWNMYSLIIIIIFTIRIYWIPWCLRCYWKSPSFPSQHIPHYNIQLIDAYLI